MTPSRTSDAESPALTPEETEILRDHLTLILRIARAGTQDGWTPCLEAVWETASKMARELGVGDDVITEIKGGSVRARLAEQMVGGV